MISFDSVTKNYGSLKIFENLSLKIPEGKTLILGKNGSGKTTLLDMIYGLRRADRGRIRVYGFYPDTSPETVRSKISYIPSIGNFPGMLKVRDVLEYISSYDSDNHISEYAEHLGVSNLLNRMVINLSSGETQILKILIGISLERRGLLLDEPLSYLDRSKRFRFVELVRRSKLDLIWTTHEEDPILPDFDQVIIIKKKSPGESSIVRLRKDPRFAYVLTTHNLEESKHILIRAGVDYAFNNGQIVIYNGIENVINELIGLSASLRKVILEE